MNKVHVTVEVGEEIFDEASIQILKKKVRELASAGTNEVLEREVRRAVTNEIQSINRSYARTKQMQKYVEDAMKEILAKKTFQDGADEITKKAIKECTEQINKAVEEYKAKSEKVIADFEKKIPERVNEILREALMGGIDTNSDELRQAIEKRVKGQKVLEPELQELSGGKIYYRCPNCHKALFYQGQKFCDDCGKAMKWDG